MIKYFFILLIVVFSFSLYSQENTKSEQELLEQLIEEIVSNSEEELDYTTLYEELTMYLNDPLNLNVATKEQLEKLYLLNEFQINSLLNYRKKYGGFLSLYELQLVYGFEIDDIKKMLPFVTVISAEGSKNIDFARALKYGSNQLFIKSQMVLEEQKGYSDITDSALAASPNSRYLGSPYKIYTRYKFNYKNQLMAGITAEKDPGEEFFKGSQKNGFDFYSAHIQINNLWKFKTITLGDFQAGFGQGLVMWNGYSYGKSSYVLNVKKRGQGLKKYSSVDENLFMRGAGTTVRVKNFDFSAFYSSKMIDANISLNDTIDEEIIEVSSFQNTGYHTTLSEVEDKDAISETIMGGNITYNHEKLKVGLTYVNYFFGADLVKNTVPYNKFEFAGSGNSNIGLNYQFSIKNINLFGEVALSENMSYAYLNGATFSIAPQVSFATVHRSYQKDYQAYYGGAFGENSKNANEQGLYIGAEILPYQKWKLSTYYDVYKFQWLKYQVDAPSNGVDYFVQLDYNMSRNVQMYWKFKNEIKAENSALDTIGLKTLSEVSNTKVRYHISYQLSKTVSMKNRFEMARYYKPGKSDDYGYLFYHDIIYKPVNVPLMLSFRYAFFDTDSYDSRIYAYENDILYAFSIPAYYYNGSRTYLTLKYTLSDNIDMWLRWGQFYYSNVNVISSGLSEIQGNTKSEVKAQIRIKF